MEKLGHILSSRNTYQTLQRRQRMSSVIEQSIKENPDEFDHLLAAIGEAYNSGKFSRLWDLLAVLSGNDRGFGNDFFFTAIEIRKGQK